MSDGPRASRPAVVGSLFKALAHRREAAGQPMGCSSALFLLVMGGLCIFGGLGGIASVVTDARINSGWEIAEGKVVHVHPRFLSSRYGGRRFFGDLETVRSDGSTLRSALPVEVPLSRRSWSDPLPVLDVGGSVLIHLDPHRPGVMVAADDLQPPLMAALAVALLLSGGVMLLAVGRASLAKRRSEPGSGAGP